MTDKDGGGGGGACFFGAQLTNIETAMAIDESFIKPFKVFIWLMAE
jgi:hypothetical protein